MSPAEVIGKNIKAIREQKGVKQEVLGKHIGVTKGRMSQIESGECDELSIKKIDKIAAYLETDFFLVTCSNLKNIHINNSTNYNGFDETHSNISPDLVKALADELINRMNK